MQLYRSRKLHFCIKCLWAFNTNNLEKTSNTNQILKSMFMILHIWKAHEKRFMSNQKFAICMICKMFCSKCCVGCWEKWGILKTILLQVLCKSLGWPSLAYFGQFWCILMCDSTICWSGHSQRQQIHLICSPQNQMYYDNILPSSKLLGCKFVFNFVLFFLSLQRSDK